VRNPEIPLWSLPLSIAILFLGAVHLAWWLSLQAGHIPACMPYWDGCTSISRAARHGLGNHLFRLVVLPCALLHLINWWLASRWLHADRARDPQARLLLALGAVSAGALALYATFLGTQGEAYQFLRRYGVTLYFGCGFLAQLVFLRLAARESKLPPGLGRAMRLVCVGMLLLGVGNVVAGALLADEAARDRVENALEWQLGLLLVGWFVLQSMLWRRAGFGMMLLR
jgi:hypothetical protein